MMSKSNYWSKEDWIKRLTRSIPFLLVFVGFIIYKSCDQKTDPYKVGSADKNLIQPIIENKKIELEKSGHITKVLWDSLSNNELEIIFQIEPFRQMFRESLKESGLDIDDLSKFSKKYAPPRLKRKLEAYNKFKTQSK